MAPNRYHESNTARDTCKCTIADALGKQRSRSTGHSDTASDAQSASVCVIPKTFNVGKIFFAHAQQFYVIVSSVLLSKDRGAFKFTVFF